MLKLLNLFFFLLIITINLFLIVIIILINCLFYFFKIFKSLKTIINYFYNFNCFLFYYFIILF